MKRPKVPAKPYKPFKPLEFLPPAKEHYFIYSGTSLADILAATSGIDSRNVTFISSEYDNDNYQFEWDAPLRRNPNYAKQLISYKENIKIYNEKLAMYNIAQKQYLKWFYEKELNKLK